MTEPLVSAPEVKDAVSQVRNRRTDAMFVAAYIAVCGMLWVVVYEPKISQYAQGVITLAIGNFIGYLTAMYNFETGTTRNAAKKDDTIVALTKAAESTATTAQVVALTPATPAAQTPAPDKPIIAANVNVEATTATLTEKEQKP